jgi:hypothetical protein
MAYILETILQNVLDSGSENKTLNTMIHKVQEQLDDQIDWGAREKARVKARDKLLAEEFKKPLRCERRDNDSDVAFRDFLKRNWLLKIDAVEQEVADEVAEKVGHVLAPSPGDATHQWWKHGTTWDWCKVCGLVRRADRQNKPCSGVMPKITLR